MAKDLVPLRLEMAGIANRLFEVVGTRPQQVSEKERQKLAAYAFGHLPRGVAVEVEHRHRGAGARQPRGAGKSDAACGPRYDRPVPLEIHVY